MKNYYVYSVLANNVSFVDYEIPKENSIGAHEFKDYVMINGGSGVVNKKTGLVGEVIETVVTKEQLDFLLTNQQFNDMVEGRFLCHSDKQLSTEKALEILTGNDNSKQLTEERVKVIAKERYADVEVVAKVGGRQ